MGLIALNLSFLSTHSSGVSLPFHLWGVEFALLLFKSQLSNTSIFPLCMTFLGYVVHVEIGLRQASAATCLGSSVSFSGWSVG